MGGRLGRVLDAEGLSHDVFERADVVHDDELAAVGHGVDEGHEEGDGRDQAHPHPPVPAQGRYLNGIRRRR